MLCNISATPERGLSFKRGGNLTLEAYIDANYAGSINNRRSRLLYILLWKACCLAKKQNVVVRSSEAAEIRVMAERICELLWMKIMLHDLTRKYEDPKKLFRVDKTIISIAHNLVRAMGQNTIR